MQDRESFFHPTQTAAKLASLSRHARLSELLEPDEFSDYATEVLPSCGERGYALRTVLAASDIDLLTDESRRSDTRLAVARIQEGLPLVIISLQFESARFRWVVPMWQPAARGWLADAFERKRFLVAVEAADFSSALTLSVGGVFDDERILVHANRVGATVPPSALIASLLEAGLVGAMAPVRAPRDALSSGDILRVMVAAQRSVAHELMTAWASLTLSLDDRVPPMELLLH